MLSVRTHARTHAHTHTHTRTHTHIQHQNGNNKLVSCCHVWKLELLLLHYKGFIWVQSVLHMLTFAFEEVIHVAKHCR